MKHTPFLHALCAELYVALIVCGVFFGSKLFEPVESIFLPMGFLSLFVFSASVMAYLFCYWPIVLFLDGKREEGVRFFIQTAAYFALFTCSVLATGIVSGILGR